MSNGLIGVMMTTVSDKIAELGIYETIKRCAQLGYRCVELGQIPMTEENITAIKRACAEFDIKLAALSTCLEPTVPEFEEECLAHDFDKIVDYCDQLDCHILRMGMMPTAYMGSREKTLAFARTADEIARRLKEKGIDLYFHNHHIDFVKYDGEYLLDIVKENTKYLGFELDIHWIQAGGENPVEVIKRYAGRIRLLHLKDYKAIPVQMPEPFDWMKLWESFGLNYVIRYAEIGEGNLPIEKCIEAGLQGGSEYFLIEQDTTYGRDTFESLRISRDNLKKMGYANWFAPSTIGEES